MTTLYIDVGSLMYGLHIVVAFLASGALWLALKWRAVREWVRRRK